MSLEGGPPEELLPCRAVGLWMHTSTLDKTLFNGIDKGTSRSSWKGTDIMAQLIKPLHVTPISQCLGLSPASNSDPTSC